MDFSTVSPYKCMGKQIWPATQNVKDQFTITIWINFVDLESQMLYTKMQPLVVLEKIF